MSIVDEIGPLDSVINKAMMSYDGNLQFEIKEHT